MRIKELALNNFRIYKGLHLIDLDTTDDSNIVIVSGKNGFGKTTFLMSLVWCLYGRQMEQVDDLYRKEIDDAGGYNKYIANSLNRLSKAKGETKFSVSLTFTDVDIPGFPCEEIKITRTYSTIGSSPETIEVLIDGSTSELSEDVGEEIFIRDFIMPIAIAKFFFFDAEKIVSLAEINTAEQRRKLSKAYSEVLGIQKYEDIKGELLILQQRLKGESATAAEKRNLNQLRGDVEVAEDTIAEHEKTIADLREELSSNKQEINKVQEKLIRYGNIISIEELEKLRDKELKLTEDVNSLSSQLKESYDIIPFAIAAENLLNIAEQLDDELAFKNARYNQDKVNEVTHKIINGLISEPKPKDFVIDYKAEDFYKTTIEKLIKQHFSSETKEFPKDFRLIHDFSQNEKDELNGLLTQIRHSFKQAFKNISGNYLQAKNELASIRRRIRAGEEHQEDDIIAADRERKAELEKKNIAHESTIYSLHSEIGGLKTKIVQKNKEIARITEKLKVSAQNKEKFETSQRLISELQDFIADFKEEKKKSLEKAIHDGLQTLMHKKGFVQKVSVEILGEDIDIVLFDAHGNEISKESLSKGEQQMYATALLKGLVEESDIEFPVFIDSPMQKFDVDHALNIVKFFYPNISDQVVIFPLVKKEMSEEEYNILKPKVAKAYLISNIDNSWSEFVSVQPSNLFEKFEELNVIAN